MSAPPMERFCAAGLHFTDLKSILGARLAHLPHVYRLLAENHLRETGDGVALNAALDLWLSTGMRSFEFTFRPNRLLMHDTTSTPALVDVAALRDEVAEAGGNPEQLTPQLPVEVSVDHSLAVDVYADRAASARNGKQEIDRNRERYAFLKWASANLKGLHVNPPGTGIMHTINMEQLATVLDVHSDSSAHPDMVLGTDSHTPMINGLGVLGWGIGGLEAESIMFGKAVSLAMPEVVGVQLKGSLPAGTLSTDLALEITARLREIDVTGCFVEFFGPGVRTLSAGDRAVIANMAPEYGASTGFFAVDERTVDYLVQTARPTGLTAAIEPVFRAMGLWFDPAERPRFDREISVHLSEMRPTIAGPRRPQDRCAPGKAAERVEAVLGRPLAGDTTGGVPDGAIGIAAITSCTNTSDPSLLIAAALLARKARTLGLSVPRWVKTSLAPGSPSARDYLARAGLLEDLAAMGFDIVGFGCTTCIGNSGPLPPVIEDALQDGKAIAAVLSGNRNFPGRVHPKLDLGFLASPPLVIAYAIKGTVIGDILSDPLGRGHAGQQVYLSDIWPKDAEIETIRLSTVRASDVPEAFQNAAANPDWHAIEHPVATRFPWNAASRSLRRPRFVSSNGTTRLGAYSAAPLMVLGDDITTDHISPAGWIDPASAAAQWLIDRGADPCDLNVYAAYRGNWEVMLRGLFTNRLARNHLADELPPGWTEIADGQRMPAFEAAEAMKAAGISTVILAGERYGMGSSRDWAAKGVALLGCKAVIARSFERIHRTNLIGMGVLPLRIVDGICPMTSGITPADRFELDLPPQDLAPHLDVTVTWNRNGGNIVRMSCQVAVETRQEIETLRQGGVLSAILRRTLSLG